MEIGVIGGGSFGTALANALKKENRINIFTRNVQVAEGINNNRKNCIYYPNKILSKRIIATTSIEVVRKCKVIFICIPSYTVINFIEELKPEPSTIIINGAKGFGNKSKLITEAIKEIATNDVFSIKGPSFANELIYELPTAFTIACNDILKFKSIKNLFRENLILFDFTTDINGVEYLGIIKNIYAIVIGIVDAQYNSANVRFLIFTKVLKEINNLLEILNIDKEILFSYAGIGDFSLTALNDLSRNRTLGLLIGKGFMGSDINNKIVIEGVNSIKILINSMSTHNHSQLPILLNLYKLLEKQIEMTSFVELVIY